MPFQEDPFRNVWVMLRLLSDRLGIVCQFLELLYPRVLNFRKVYVRVKASINLVIFGGIYHIIGVYYAVKCGACTQILVPKI